MIAPISSSRIFGFVFRCCDGQVISKLLDVASLAGKPNYDMAPDVPLMLYGCEYESLNFHRSASACGWKECDVLLV